MTRNQRLLLAALVWLLAGVLGWWWQRPAAEPAAAAALAATAASAPAASAPPTPQQRAARIAEADAMGLKSTAAAAAGAAAPAAPGATELHWRLAALVVRGGERYAVLTASEQPTMKLRVGDSLPDGDRIRAIHVNRIDVVSPRGRPRTLHLIEP